MASISGISYVRYQAPDLDRMEQFLVDFGFSRSVRTTSALYMRGTGTDHHIHITELGDTPRALGIGLRVDSRQELEVIAAKGGAKIEDSHEPGGGQRAVLTDPNGFRVDVIYGRESVQPLPVRRPLSFNDSVHTRRVGELQRPARGATHIARMEHAVLVGPQFDASLIFYQELLGMKASDWMYAGNEENTVAVFLHCGLGTTYTDHHTLALAKTPDVAIDHSAFVAIDWDDLMLGHEHLKAAGYLHEWGVGRHTFGSEIFDYWRDPFGNKVEHTTDGDMVNDSHQAGNSSMVVENFSVWAPPQSESYGKINVQ